MKYLLFFILVGLATPCVAQTVEKGAVTTIMSAGRIVDQEELTSTGQLPYSKGVGVPFSIFLVPKNDANVKEVEFVKVQYYQGEGVVTAPLTINAWNVGAFIKIDVDNPTLFTNYYVYVGFGQDKPE